MSKLTAERQISAPGGANRSIGHMTVLHSTVTSRILELGGSINDSEPTLGDSLAAIDLPPLFSQEAVFEDFDGSCDDEKRALFRAAILSESVDYTTDVLPLLTSTFKVFYHRGPYPKSVAVDLATWALTEDEREHVMTVAKAQNLLCYEFGFWDGWWPDSYYIFMTDPNPENPTVISTDHEVSWKVNHVHAEGSLEEFLQRFMTPVEALAGLRETVL